MRLIDANKIYDAVERRYQVSSGIEHMCERDLLELICISETVDAVEVVRCKDCKYGEVDNADFHDQYLCHISGSDWNCGNHFCSYGERKDGDGNG